MLLSQKYILNKIFLLRISKKIIQKLKQIKNVKN